MAGSGAVRVLPRGYLVVCAAASLGFRLSRLLYFIHPLFVLCVCVCVGAWVC